MKDKATFGYARIHLVKKPGYPRAVWNFFIQRELHTPTVNGMMRDFSLNQKYPYKYPLDLIVDPALILPGSFAKERSTAYSELPFLEFTAEAETEEMYYPGGNHRRHACTDHGASFDKPIELRKNRLLKKTSAAEKSAGHDSEARLKEIEALRQDLKRLLEQQEDATVWMVCLLDIRKCRTGTRSLECSVQCCG